MKYALFLLTTLCISSSLIGKGNEFEEYLTFLEKHKHALGEKGSYENGEIEIVKDPKEIKAIQDLQKSRFKKMGMSEQEATEASRIGILSEDIYWILIRDAVIFPTGAAGSYNRILWKSALHDGVPGIAILPILPDGKIVLNLNYRHATRSWELEIPRGYKMDTETIEEALSRELEEETGFKLGEKYFLGNIAPDSGAIGCTVPVYLGKVSKQGIANQDYTEAILRVETFTPKELKELLSQGSTDLQIGKKKKTVYIRDGFLSYALLQAETKGLL